MSNGDDEAAADPETEAEDETVPSPDDGSETDEQQEDAVEDGDEDETTEPDSEIEAFESRLDDLEAALEAAETEADLDGLEADADAFEADLGDAEFPVPEPEDDEEEPENPKEPLEDRLSDLRDGIEDQRGPYGEDVEGDAADAAARIRDTRWTRDGKPDVRAAVETFLETSGAELGEGFDPDGEDDGAMAETVEAVGETAADGRLDADEDAATIAALLEAVEELGTALDDAEEWDDLEIAEQLRREGFYDRLTPETRKDFPPELGVVRIAEAESDPEPILMALESLDSEFMQENCIDALRRLGPEEALEPMQELAQRRDQGAIEVLGKIGDERAVETLVEFVDSGNPPLQKVTIRALGEIGSEEASQAIANAMADENPDVRSIAARALGLVGDTRAIEPLSARLADEGEADEVRASAAWALVRIGTERALRAAAEYADDRVYTVQHEAELAREATA
jgi:HEAT repeat protein